MRTLVVVGDWRLEVGSSDRFHNVLGWIGFFATLWCAYFFRNPDRVIPEGENLVLSPADGLLQSIQEGAPPAGRGLCVDAIYRKSRVLCESDL